MAGKAGARLGARAMSDSGSTIALIVAAGSGARAGGDVPKQYRQLGGKPVLAHSLAAFAPIPTSMPSAW